MILDVDDYDYEYDECPEEVETDRKIAAANVKQREEVKGSKADKSTLTDVIVKSVRMDDCE